MTEPLFNIPPTTDWLASGMSEEAVLGLDPRVKHRSEVLAWNTLARLCAYQIGVAPETIRPCTAGCIPTSVSWIEAVVDKGNATGLPMRTIGTSFTPNLRGGKWYNSCGCRRGDCSCSTLRTVHLPGPVGDVVSVKLDGEELSPAMYRIDNFDELVSLDDTVVWPGCQDMSLPDTEPGTFSVTYFRGAAPNELTNYAAGILASEFAKAASSSGKCRLPAGVTSVTRGGATYEISSGLFENGMTGIREVDAVIAIYNPNRLKAPPRVLVPGAGRQHRRTTWGSIG